MNTAIKRAGSLVTALAWTLGSGMSAVADDTELFSAAAPSGVAGQPNVLFILDTSLSMEEEIVTAAAYDPDLVYDGLCEKDYIFYTKGVNINNCQGGPKEDAFPENSNHCEASWDALTNVGQWQGNILQWNSDKSQWEEPKKIFDSNEVDCENDQGTHGKTGNPEPWAVDDGMYMYGPPPTRLPMPVTSSCTTATGSTG